MSEPTYPAFLGLQHGAIVLNADIPKSDGSGTNWPHKVDFYIPAGGYLRAIVCLHGGGGRKGQFAAQCLVTSAYPPTLKSVNWAMLNRYNTIAVFPQGQACIGPLPGGAFNPFNPNDIDSRTTQYPNGVSAWDNGFVWSGVDDISFLTDLKTYISNTYLTAYPNAVSLAGHSAGGIMTKRMWLRGVPYANFATTSGPTSLPDAGTVISGARPLWMQVGQVDANLNITDGPDGPGDHFYSPQWSQAWSNVARVNVAYPALSKWRGDWDTAKMAYAAMGGIFAILPEDAVVTATPSGGELRTWSYLYGHLTVRLISNAPHDFVEQQRATKQRTFGQWMNWIRQN